MVHRYTDFLVNEILPSGEVVHLDNLKAPKKSSAKPANKSPSKPPVSAGNSQGGDSAAPEHSEAQNEAAEVVPQRVLVQPDPVNRQKHKVFVRQTEQGIEEVTKEKKDDASQGNGTHGEQLEVGKENAAQPEPGKGDGAPPNAAASPQKVPVPSTAGDWQAYAGNPSGGAAQFEVCRGLPGGLPLRANALQLSPADSDVLAKYFGSETVSEIVALYNRIVDSPHRAPRTYGSVKSAQITDRAMRTSIHQDLRRIFQSRLESATDNDGAMLITAASEQSSYHGRTPNNNKQSSRKPQNRGPQWQELGGNHLHFTLYKENKDTMEVISFLCKQLRVQPRSFQFAGTKDRRGITAQRVSAFRIPAERMVDVGRTLRNAKVGDYEYLPYELRLGDLVGNEFVISLRDCQFVAGNTVDAAKATLEAAVSSLRTKGFLNYYGLQRFGTFATSTDAVGIKMLQGDFRGAIDAILDFNPALLAPDDESTTYDRIANEDKARARAIDTFKHTGKSHPALDELPRKFSAESAVIRHLGGRNQANDVQGALNNIPRNLRLMYVHAYQSLVWNVMTSERWRQYGDKVIEGDLVLVGEHADKTSATTEPEQTDADGEPVFQPSSEDRATNADEAFVRARVLSKDEAESGSYSIFDIVLPTPGFDILYPANNMASLYKDFMASERGGGLDPHDMRRQWKDISLSGSYRKLMARPGDGMSYEVKTYSKEDEQFVETDLDRLTKGTQAGKANGTSEEVKKQPEDAVMPDADDQEQKIAVILKLQLGSSQYATMALRELLGPGGLQTYKPDFGQGR